MLVSAFEAVSIGTERSFQMRSKNPRVMAIFRVLKDSAQMFGDELAGELLTTAIFEEEFAISGVIGPRRAT